MTVTVSPDGWPQVPEGHRLTQMGEADPEFGIDENSHFVRVRVISLVSIGFNVIF